MCHSERSAAATCVLFIDSGWQPGVGGGGGEGRGLKWDGGKIVCRGKMVS